jgi:hypothetical protein
MSDKKLKIVLKDVDFIDIYNNFDNYNVSVDIPKNIPFNKNTTLFKEKFENDITKSVYQMDNEKLIYINNNTNKSKKCWYCKEKLDENKENHVGCPIQYKQSYELEDGVYKITHIFHIEGTFCNVNCCYQYILYDRKVNYTHRDLLLSESLSNLKLLCRIMNEKLGDTIDYRLSEEYGGIKFNNLHKFKRTTRVVIHPCSVSYVKV